MSFLQNDALHKQQKALLKETRSEKQAGDIKQDRVMEDKISKHSEQKIF